MHRKDDWKESWYGYVPKQSNFGALTGFAEDIVKGGRGFDTHPHRNMEISTIILSGAQKHRDTTGKEFLLDEFSVQTMTAGTGIQHSEFNASETEPVHSFQIWVYPKLKNIAPVFDNFKFKPEGKLNQILLVLSPDGRNGTGKTNQDAFFSLSRLDQGAKIEYKLNLQGNGIYLHVARGQVRINNLVLKYQDAVEITDCDTLQISADSSSDLVFVEVPLIQKETGLPFGI